MGVAFGLVGSGKFWVIHMAVMVLSSGGVLLPVRASVVSLSVGVVLV